MKYEKSCGAVVFRSIGGKQEYLLILNKKGNAKGHWGFPKGHIEKNETELETAKREIFEETGLSVNFVDGFRKVTTYSPFEGITKDVVYFLAEASNSDVVLQESEVKDFLWCEFEKAEKTLTFDSRILKAANAFINK